MKVNSNAPNAEVQINDSTFSRPLKLKIKRSNKDLSVKLISNTLTKDFIIKASPNPEFVYGNLIWAELCPVAYLIDLTNRKRYYYGKIVSLNLYNSSTIIKPTILKHYEKYISHTYPTSQRQINLTLSLPWINNFYLHPQNETTKANTGFWGISAGLEYYYKNNKYLSLTASALMDFFVPVPAAVDISGEYALMSSTYFSLMDNYKFKRFSVGYGLNYSRNTWDYRYYTRFNPPPPTREPVKKTSNSVGLTINGHYQIGKHFFIGLIYRPTVLAVKPTPQFKYEHLISMEFAWKIRLRK